MPFIFTFNTRGVDRVDTPVANYTYMADSDLMNNC